MLFIFLVQKFVQKIIIFPTHSSPPRLTSPLPLARAPGRTGTGREGFWAGGGGPRGRASGGSKQGLGKSSPSKPPASCAVASKAKMGGAGKPGASGLDEGAGVSASWVNKVVGFLESNGQDLLSSICAHYRIDFCGDVSSIRDYSLEQLAHNAIFNPALPKAAGRLPKMLRDIPGVSNWSPLFLCLVSFVLPSGLATSCVPLRRCRGARVQDAVAVWRRAAALSRPLL